MGMHGKFRIAMMAAAVVLLASPAEAGRGPGGQFQKADFDRDGLLSPMEACRGLSPALCQHFDQIDLNRDRALSREEVQDWHLRTKAAKKSSKKASKKAAKKSKKAKADKTVRQPRRDPVYRPPRS
ncbi:MAG: EF-hand domain-containing protein [Casimicrobiaceae bacterium]|nr:EF-hand domain-containing protein [Casimicrobiaceae bacterium]